MFRDPEAQVALTPRVLDEEFSYLGDVSSWDWKIHVPPRTHKTSAVTQSP
jgi:hypothetical protein